MSDNSPGISPAAARDPVVVVGGGIVGASVAYYLREQDVVLVEKSMPGSGTTATSIAQFIRHQDAPTAAEAERRRRSWACYGPLVADETLDFGAIGTLHTASSEDGLARISQLAADLDAVGVTTELLEPDAVAQYGIDPETVLGALSLPDDGVLDPGEIVQHFLTEAHDSGVTVETGTAVTDVVVDDGQVTSVETTQGAIEAEAVVNAAGPWASHIDDMVGVSAPLRHTHGPIVVLGTETNVTLPLTFFEGGYYVREEGDRQLFAGRFATDYDEATTLDPGASHAAAAGEEFCLEIADLLAQHMPSVESLTMANSWVGLRTVTPDGNPLVGPTDIDGYVHATGMSGHGITLAPVVGQLLAEWWRSGECPHLLCDYLPSRFG
jgi:sarcosine oxidase subunit beta